MNKFLILLLSISLVTLSVNNIKAQEKFETCKCYCSDKCGPRDAHPGDAPFIDEETGLCFCQKRDFDNYYAYGCDAQPMPEEGELTCCGE